MLRYINGQELARHPRLRASMFQDRACQFRKRLGWEVAVDASGWEQDQYDELNPLYVIWEMPDGTHGGSMRFLPTTGRTMVNEHFAALIPGGRLSDPAIWECTRFCLSERAGANVSAALMLGGAEVGTNFGLSQAAGVFDARMVRIYRMLGWPPTLIGQQGEGKDMIGLGLWTFSEAIRRTLADRAGISSEVSRHWFLRSAPLEALAA